jgi:hypothetical protein
VVAVDRGLAATAGLLSLSDDDDGMVQLQAVRVEVDPERRRRQICGTDQGCAAAAAALGLLSPPSDDPEWLQVDPERWWRQIDSYGGGSTSSNGWEGIFFF